MNWIFLPSVACKIQVWNRLKIQFLKLDISNWRIAKIKCRCMGARLNFINLSPKNMCMTLFYNRFLTTYHIIWCYWNLPLQYLDNNRNCSHQNSLPLQILKNCSNEWIFYHSNADILQYSHNWKQHCNPYYIERIWGQSILQLSYGPTCWAIGIS